MTFRVTVYECENDDSSVLGITTVTLVELKFRLRYLVRYEIVPEEFETVHMTFFQGRPPCP